MTKHPRDYTRRKITSVTNYRPSPCDGAPPWLHRTYTAIYNNLIQSARDYTRPMINSEEIWNPPPPRDQGSSQGLQVYKLRNYLRASKVKRKQTSTCLVIRFCLASAAVSISSENKTQSRRNLLLSCIFLRVLVRKTLFIFTGAPNDCLL